MPFDKLPIQPYKLGNKHIDSGKFNHYNFFSGAEWFSKIYLNFLNTLPAYCVLHLDFIIQTYNTSGFLQYTYL